MEAELHHEADYASTAMLMMWAVMVKLQKIKFAILT